MASNTVQKIARDVNEIISFDEAMQQGAADGLAPDEVTYIANPYTVLNGNDKDTLVDVPFYIRHVEFRVDEKSDRPYVVVYTVTAKNELYIITDGSTGIYAQLRKLVDTRTAEGHNTPTDNILVANGLRRSDYFHEASKSEATTFYLA